MSTSPSQSQAAPFFSICIPQYNRTSFLLLALQALEAQTCTDFEVCISDDVSNDGRDAELRRFLADSSLRYSYVRQQSNLRYDANIRASIALAQGRYCLLHGNDDCLQGPSVLADLKHEIQQHDFPAVVIPNFENWDKGEITRRIQFSGMAGAGPEVAVAHYRNVAFVTGVILERSRCHSLSTSKWDGSEMYQMYLMARIIAGGGQLMTLEASVVRKDIRIEGEQVDSYAMKPRLDPCPVIERSPPFVQIGILIADAIEPYLEAGSRDRILRKLLTQLYLFTYPFWIFEYRQVQSWPYALGICMGIRPRNVFGAINLSLFTSVWLRLLYCAICIAGLLLPVRLFKSARPWLYRLAKAVRKH